MAIRHDDMLVLSTLACTFHAECIVYVGARPMSPSDADWAEYARFIERHKMAGREIRALIHERGYGPTLSQRTKMLRVAAGFDIRVAVLTDSPFARVITVLVALVNPGFEAFPYHAVGAALTYLGFGAERREEFSAVLTMLRERLDGRATPPQELMRT